MALFLRRFPFESGRWRLVSTALTKCKQEVQAPSIRVVRTRSGFRMQVDVNEWLGRHIYVTGEYEPSTTAVIRASLKPGDVFVDVGANAGYFSLLASRIVGHAGEVFSFEPVPVVRDQLQRNVELNQLRNCRVFDFAASNEDGEIELFVGPEDHRGVSSLRRLPDASEAIRVPQKRLDDVLANEPRIDLVKIDVEGAECHVLEGMLGVMQRFRPGIVLEVTKAFLESMERSVEDIERILCSFGYGMYAIEEKGLQPLPKLSTHPNAQFNALFALTDRLPLRIPILAPQAN